MDADLTLRAHYRKELAREALVFASKKMGSREVSVSNDDPYVFLPDRFRRWLAARRVMPFYHTLGMFLLLLAFIAPSIDFIVALCVQQLLRARLLLVNSVEGFAAQYTVYVVYTIAMVVTSVLVVHLVQGKEKAAIGSGLPVRSLTKAAPTCP